MSNHKTFFLLPLVLLFPFWANSAAAQQPAAPILKTDQDDCGKQPNHEPGTPKFINFCGCLPKGPLNAESRGSLSGEVDIQFEIDAGGALVDLRLLKSSGYWQLDRYVWTAVANCGFEPAQKDGKAIKGFLIQRYIIEDGDKLGLKGHGVRVENGAMK